MVHFELMVTSSFHPVKAPLVMQVAQVSPTEGLGLASLNDLYTCVDHTSMTKHFTRLVLVRLTSQEPRSSGLRTT